MNTLAAFSVKLLGTYGLRRVFLSAEDIFSPGELGASAPECVYFSTPQAAACAAGGCAQVRQQLAAVITQNAVPAEILRVQKEQCIPVIYIAKTPAEDTQSLKFHQTLATPLALGNLLEEAVFHAVTGRNGPVWLHVPLEIFSAPPLEEATPTRTYEFVRPTAYKQQLTPLLRELSCAKHPLVLASSAVRAARAEHELEDMQKHLRLPVLLTRSAIDLLPSSSPYYAGRIDAPQARQTLLLADFILCLGGCKQEIRRLKTLNPSAFLAAVDIDETLSDLPYTLFLHADLRDFLIDLYTQGPAPVPNAGWIYMRQLWNGQPAPASNADAAGLTRPAVIRTLTRLLAPNTLLCAHHSWADTLELAAQTKEGQRFIFHHAGNTIQMAAGACLCNYRRKTICLEEGYLSPEVLQHALHTLKRLNLPVKCFLAAKAPLSAYEPLQKKRIKTLFIQRAEELESTLTTALQTPGPVVCLLNIEKDAL